MKLCLYQGEAHAFDKDGALATMERTLQGCSALSCDTAIFPELFLTGYNIGSAAKQLAEPLDGPSIGRMASMAKRHGVALIAGFVEALDDAVFNSAIVFDQNGQQLAVYRKIQRYGERERAVFARGADVPVFTLGGITCGLLICYDVEFAEMVRLLAKQAVELLLVPTANMQPFFDVARILVPARALENGISIAYANYCGVDGDLTYSGLSCIVGEDGQDLARAGVRGQAVLCADLSVRHATPALKSTQLQDWHDHR